MTAVFNTALSKIFFFILRPRLCLSVPDEAHKAIPPSLSLRARTGSSKRLPKHAGRQSKQYEETIGEHSGPGQLGREIPHEGQQPLAVFVV
jgi:hypothetical protein